MSVGALQTTDKKITINEVAGALFRLPSEQVAMVYDFILFLQTRYGQPVDESDVWTEEDLVEFREASLQYAASTILADEQDSD